MASQDSQHEVATAVDPCDRELAFTSAMSRSSQIAIVHIADKQELSVICSLCGIELHRSLAGCGAAGLWWRLRSSPTSVDQLRSEPDTHGVVLGLL